MRSESTSRSEARIELPAFFVLGTGFFAPSYASVDAVHRGEARAAVMPTFPIVLGRARRFTSLVTQMHLEASGLALAAATVDAKRVRSIFASANGELATALHILESMDASASVSAARFVQSVHNTPSGVFSIATGNTLPSNTVAAGEDTVAAALVEAAWMCAEDPSPVLVSFADEPIPALFRPEREVTALAVAFVVAGEGAGRKCTLYADDGVSPEPGASGQHDVSSPIRLALALAASLGARHDAMLLGSLATDGPWSRVCCRIEP